MAFELPSHLTSDAVPEKRTTDEQNQPPSFQQAQEYVRRLDENSTCDQDDEKTHPNDSTKPPSPTEEAQEKKESSSKKKPKKSEGKSSKKPSHTTNIVNISNASGFQICGTYTNVTNYLNGVPSMFHKSNTDTMQNPRTDAHQRPTLPVPERVFRCLDRVSEEDCRIVSEYVTCDWKALGEQLFQHNMNHLKDFITPAEGNSKKEAVRLILIRWKQVNCKVADVRQLCLVLQKLNETEALIRLANRHGIK
uniref:Putative oxidoreductase GLYR1 n=1 Tax=Lygus hesperus TaxID=30085 RepID=A0A0A9XTM0_LYGHE